MADSKLLKHSWAKSQLQASQGHNDDGDDDDDDDDDDGDGDDDGDDDDDDQTHNRAFIAWLSFLSSFLTVTHRGLHLVGGGSLQSFYQTTKSAEYFPINAAWIRSSFPLAKV